MSGSMALLGLALTLLVAAAGLGLGGELRRRGLRLPKQLEALGLWYLAWLGLGFAQAQRPDDLWLLTLGSLVLPLALALTWVFVLANVGSAVRAILARPWYRWLALGGALYYAGFYLYSTRLVGPAEASVTSSGPVSGSGFVTIAQAYGPLAIWPIVEFWIPALDLFGGLSLGTGLLVATLAPLVGATLALLAYAIRLRRAFGSSAAALAGSTIAALGTTYCCCCPPVLTPLLAAVLGSTVATPAAGLLLGSSSPLYNLTQVATLALAAAGVALLGARLERTGLACGTR